MHSNKLQGNRIQYDGNRTEESCKMEKVARKHVVIYDNLSYLKLNSSFDKNQTVNQCLDPKTNESIDFDFSRVDSTISDSAKRQRKNDLAR